MIIIGSDKKLNRIFSDWVKANYDQLEKQVNLSMSGIKGVVDLTGKLKELQTQVSTLEIQKSQREEEYKIREREIEHKLGLEKQRQKQELEFATRDAQLKAREDNLQNERDLFKKEMDFNMGRFTKEVEYQRELSEKLLTMLPKMTIKQEIKDGN